MGAASKCFGARRGSRAPSLPAVRAGAIAIHDIASLGCCGADGRAGPQDRSEWIGLDLPMPGMMVLCLVPAGGASLAVEGMDRLADRARRSQ